MHRKKTLSTPLALAILTLMLGSIFRIQHWPYGFEINLGSLLTVGALYTLRYFFKKAKTLKDTAKVVMVVVWVLLSVLVLFKITYFSSVRIILYVPGFLWLLLEIRDLIKRKPNHEGLNILQWLGMGIVFIYLFFQFMFWPFQGFTLALYYFIGHPLLAIGFLMDAANQKKSPPQQ